MAAAAVTSWTLEGVAAQVNRLQKRVSDLEAAIHPACSSGHIPRTASISNDDNDSLCDDDDGVVAPDAPRPAPTVNCISLSEMLVSVRRHFVTD